jgi:hypothetical protein
MPRRRSEYCVRRPVPQSRAAEWLSKTGDTLKVQVGLATVDLRVAGLLHASGRERWG